jgi:hypothetical protein
MEEFVHRQNLLLLRRRLDDPSFSEAERKIIRRLLAEEHAKNPGPRRDRANNDAATSAHFCRSSTAVDSVDTVPIPYSVKFRAT